MSKISISTAHSLEEYIAALAGWYVTVQDSCLVSGTSSAYKFSSYIYLEAVNTEVTGK